MEPHEVQRQQTRRRISLSTRIIASQASIPRCQLRFHHQRTSEYAPFDAPNGMAKGRCLGGLRTAFLGVYPAGTMNLSSVPGCALQRKTSPERRRRPLAMRIIAPESWAHGASLGTSRASEERPGIANNQPWNRHPEELILAH